MVNHIVVGLPGEKGVWGGGCLVVLELKMFVGLPQARK